MHLTQQQLDQILLAHQMWTQQKGYGRRAHLQRANLRGADLQRAHLQGANLQGVDLQAANLRDIRLAGTNLLGVTGIVLGTLSRHTFTFILSTLDLTIGCERRPLLE